MKNKAIITGSSGFVGKYLSSYLISKGYEVWGIEKNCPGSDIRTFEGDIADIAFLKEVFSRVKPDLIFHLAAQSSVALSFKEPEMTMKVNYYGTKNIFDAAMEKCPNARILLACSADSYGIPEEVPIKESHSLNPKSPYAESKVKAEELAVRYAKEKGLKVVIARAFPHIGPGQSDIFVASSFARQIAENEKTKKDVIRVGNLDAKRDFTDVRDVVRAYELALRKCRIAEPYNISAGKTYSIREILDMLLSMSKTRMRVEKDPERMRPSDIPVLSADSQKFKEETGWKAEIDIKDTLKEMLDYWREKV